MTQHQILIVGNEGLSRGAIRHHLEDQGFRVEEARSGNIARQLLQREPFDVVLVDDRPESQEGSARDIDDWLRSGVPILYWTHLQAGLADEAVSLNLDLLSAEIERAIELSDLREEVARLRRRVGAQVDEPSPLIGESASMRNVVSLIGRICEGPDVPVLIEGEDGVGKRTVAMTLHRGSPRGTGPFLELACRGRLASELEQRLFGDETHPGTDPGLLVDAAGGTLYIRDIDVLSIPLQARLLEQLGEHGRGRGAGDSPRLIACTSTRLEDRVRDGRFRPELHRLLQAAALPIPPLRERSGDICLLADWFVKRAARVSGRAVERFSPDALAALATYDWPGNVAELRSVIDRLVWIRGERVLERSDLPPEIASLGERGESASSEFQIPLGELTLEEIEVRTLRAALDKTGHNQVRAAQLLGVSRDTLRYRMKKFGLLSRRQRRVDTVEAH